ncbi:AraC family transcriptional regulator [Paenibacillus agricola]|uniref:AraC family transcriptional regulator n=1 Tax=Paenibacillus agricola TaxID=2716264 RepID=A0ABX0J5F7_9BACL|nr:AraC family transcriptional regulator [Paenibacillus agricola]NHN31041.1 AraC family transcriptional regulator [Paenibacillus agricola]
MPTEWTEEFPLLHVSFQRSGNAGKARCEPGWHWRPHKPLHDYDLWYAVSGKGTMTINGESFPIHKGSCFLIRPGDVTDAVQDQEDRLTVIFVHFDIFHPITNPVTPLDNSMRLDPRVLPERHTVVGDPLFMEILLNRLLQISEPEHLWQETENNLLMKQILLHLYRWQHEAQSSSASKHKQVIARVISYIREDISRRISHQEIANHVQLSAEYLSSLFKKYTGTSIKQYMTAVRLERALHLLMETPMNVSQVAEALGYDNIYFFSKQFKDYYGAPPSHYKWNTEPSSAHGQHPDK